MPGNKPIEFSRLNESNIQNLTLTIYFTEPFSTFKIPPKTVHQLITYYVPENEVIVIKSDELCKHIDLLKQIDSVCLKPVEEKKELHLRIYYEFLDSKTKRRYSVSMWSQQGSMGVNGVEVHEEELFYNVILPFLAENQAQELEMFIGRKPIEVLEVPVDPENLWQGYTKE